MEENTFQILNNAMELILIFKPTGKIIFANASALTALGYDSVEEGILISDIFPEMELAQVKELSMKNAEEAILERMAYRKNRTCFNTSFKIRTWIDTGFILYATDVSRENYFERQANLADEQMENAEQMKNQFVATVTHELRTPVNGILGNVRVLQKVEEDPSKIATLKLMERGCNDMHALINNILDFSKLNAGKLELEQKAFNFRELMDYIKSNHINKIAEKGLNFFMNISPEIPEIIIGDELRIGQVLNNFLSNATKFTSTGKITVEAVKTAQMGERVELFFMVIDTGIGIDKESQDKLFKSFSQVDASITRRFGGTGLGLNISKQLVEMMGGNVHVESEKNKGSMFSFHIWVKIPVEEGKELDKEMHSYQVELPGIADLEENQELFTYGTEENITEIKKKLSKLILCVEMDNWEKAESFMEGIKQLTANASQPVRSATLRLKMAVQKADYDKMQAAHDAFKNALENDEGEKSE